MYVLGPMAIFPRTVLSWNVGNVNAINEDSLLLFCLIEPKIGKKILCYGICWFPDLFIHEAVSDSCVKWKRIEDCSILQWVAMCRWQLNRDTCWLHCQGHQSTSKCWYLYTALLDILSCCEGIRSYPAICMSYIFENKIKIILVFKLSPCSKYNLFLFG